MAGGGNERILRKNEVAVAGGPPGVIQEHLVPAPAGRFLQQALIEGRLVRTFAPAGPDLDFVQRDDIGVGFDDPRDDPAGIVDAVGAPAAMMRVVLQHAKRCRR